MARFYGKVGYALPAETVDGVYTNNIKERDYYGDVRDEMIISRNEGQVNDDISLSQLVAIVADKFAYENFQRIKFVELYGALWLVTSVKVERPRLLLRMGGPYNGPRA